MEANDPLAGSLSDVLELQEFLYALISGAIRSHPAPEEDISHIVEGLGLQLPAGLEPAPIQWEGGVVQGAGKQPGRTLILTTPGHPDALGLTKGCICIHGRRYCLECGIWCCRIVIRF